MLNDLNISSLRQTWQQTKDPFPYVSIENFLSQSVAMEQYETIKTYLEREKSTFVKYSQRWEKLKFAQNDLTKMPTATADVLRFFNSRSFIERLEQITGLSELLPDDRYWGGGIHSTFTSGKLDIHHDFTILPTTYGMEWEWQRVLNLIVYLNPKWVPSWKGELEFWDSQMTERKKAVQPVFNRGVLFYTFSSNHGQPDPFEGPVDEPRISLATYYYQRVRPGTIEHKSTLYQVRPGETESDEERRVRLERSSAERYAYLKSR